MQALELVKPDHPALWRISEPLDPISMVQDLDLMTQMQDFVIKNFQCLGVAAPQFGFRKRIICILTNREPREVTLLINPMYMGHSFQQNMRWEACLSFPGYQARVRRWNSITIQYLRFPDLVPISTMWHNNQARVIQHEIDHLNGICKVGNIWRKEQHARIKAN